MSSTNFRCRAERLPLRKLFKRDCAFPRAVRGPVDFLALLRLACKRAGVSVGDLRNDMAAPHDKPATSIHPSLISSRDILSQKAPAGGAETDLLFNLWLDQSRSRSSGHVQALRFLRGQDPERSGIVPLRLEFPHQAKQNRR